MRRLDHPKMELAKIQKFTNKVAAAIHTIDSELLVSTGSVNIQYQKYWNDTALVAKGGEQNGTLDFLQTHYYPYYQADAVSPFLNTPTELATKYGFDANKPVIGEFPASGWKGDTYTSTMAAKTELSAEECYRKAFDNGYAGALAWQYIGDKTESKFGGYSYTIEPAPSRHERALQDRFRKHQDQGCRHRRRNGKRHDGSHLRRRQRADRIPEVV